MELMDALRTRRAVREFTQDTVEASEIEALIAAAILAPSAVNLQPWAFAVVNSAARLHELSNRVREYALAHVPANSPLAGHLADPHFEIFHGAAALVIVCATNDERQSAEDCCLAAEGLMLAAHDKGLGTCWIGMARPWLNEPSTKAELGIAADLTPIAPIIIGRSVAEAITTSRRPARILWCR